MSTFDQMKSAWAGFSVPQKLSIGAIFVLVFGSLCALPFMLKSDDYGILFANLEEQDAGQVVAKLKSEGVAYKLSAGGKTVLVPQDKVYETRLQMAMANLPGSAVGFELFDKANFGVSDFVQELNFQRALQGELSRTIMQLESVEQARVHIVLPKESVFVEDTKEPTASVVLKLRRSAVLGKKQIDGIVHLVAASVEGLKPKNITIIDSEGNALAVGNDVDSTAQLTSTQYEMVQNVEKYLEGKAQSMLDKILGPQRSVVRISVDLDFDQIKTEKETYDPDSVVRSEQLTSITSTGGAPEEEGNSTGNYKKDETVNNYEVGKTVQQIVAEVGNVKRLSVALVVDGKYQAVADSAEKVYVPRNEEEVQKYAELVQESVNYNEERGDTIKVQNIPFDTSYRDELKKELDESEKKASAGRRNEFILASLGKVGKFLVIGLIIFLGIKKLASMKPTAPQTAGGAGSTTPAAPPRETAAAAAAAAPPAKTAAATPAMDGNDADRIAENLKKTWLSGA